MNHTDPVIPPAWGTPGAVRSTPPIPKAGQIILIAIGCFMVALVAATVLVGPADDDSPSGSFYASAGWTVQRAADLSVKIQRDDGAPRATADCAMKDIVGSTTWLEWQAMGRAGQLAAIRTAERVC